MLVACNDPLPEGHGRPADLDKPEDALLAAGDALEPEVPDASASPFDLTLTHGINGLGLNITTDALVDGVVVVAVAAGGQASLDGRLQAGDVIVAINGVSTVGISHDAAVEFLRAGSEVTLTLRRGLVVVEPDAIYSDLRSVSLLRVGRRLGLLLYGDEENGCVRVGRVEPGVAAEECGAIQVGDMVVAVNGFHVAGNSRAEVVALMQATDRVDLVLQTCLLPAPEDVTDVQEDFIVLKRREGESLGFCFETFSATPGVFVKRVVPDGLAAIEGHMREGDRIIEVRFGGTRLCARLAVPPALVGLSDLPRFPVGCDWFGR